MTQGKIERYHRTLKNVVNLKNYCLLWRLEQKIGEFVEYYSRARDITAARHLVKEQRQLRIWQENMGVAPLTEALTKPGLLRKCVC